MESIFISTDIKFSKRNSTVEVVFWEHEVQVQFLAFRLIILFLLIYNLDVV